MSKSNSPPLIDLLRSRVIQSLMKAQTIVKMEITPQPKQRDFCLKLRTVPLPFPVHFYPLFWTQFYPETLT